MIDTVVISGGGTGGHLSVARALMEELNKKDVRIIFIGSAKGADKQWFGDEPKFFKKYFLNTRGVVNQNFFGKIKSLFMIFNAVIKVLLIYKKYKVTKVISVGGFSAAPASFATFLCKVDFYIHEQNSIMGKLNQITLKNAKELFSSYDKKALIKDYPINRIFFKKARVRDKIKTVIFLGGSQGAKAINDFALSVAPILRQKNINIIHQVGKLDFYRVKKEYDKLNIKADIFDFTTNILEKMDKSDFAISRAGASTLWELSALGMPTLYVPYPYAAANHQYFNAKFLLNDDLCFLQNERELNTESFIQILDSDIQIKSENLIKSIQKDGALKIINKILE